MIKRKARFRLLLTIALVFSFSYLTSGCFSFRMSTKEVNNYFEEKSISGSIHEYENKDGREIRYVATDTGELRPLVVFVHGSPGSLSAFIDYLSDTSLTRRARVVSVDRPGFGHSGFGHSEPSLVSQAAALIPILKDHPINQPVILVGHSLGGPLIARMAMDFPKLVDGLIMVAPSIAPELEPNETWFRYPLQTPFLRWVLPKSFRASNDEIYHLKNELELMLPLWKDIRCPVTVIQGGKDNLVHPGNADFAKRRLINAPVEIVFIKDMNHFVPWTHSQLIQKAIIKHLDKKRNDNNNNPPMKSQ